MLRPREPIFLINRDKASTYEVCLPASAVEVPGLEAEVEAAARVWARAVGRELRVEFRRGCDKGGDLLFAFRALREQALGETGFKQTTTTTTTANSKTVEQKANGRYLYLRDFAKAPLKENPKLAWISAREAFKMKAEPTADEILARLEARDAVVYSLDDKVVRLMVLIHEFGHVWGLCDLYSSNQRCDPKHATTLDADGRGSAVMGPNGPRQPLFLGDDDFAGIRALALRQGFDAGWKTPVKVLKKAQPPAKLPEVEVYQAQLASKPKGKVVKIRAQIVTNRPARFWLEARLKGTEDWRPVSKGHTGKPRVDEPRLNYTLELEQDASELDFRVSLEVQTAGGKWAAARHIGL